MDAERARALLLSLPNAVETVQWGDNMVFWVGDKRLGGKMFALLDCGASAGAVISYAAGPERYYELLEREGVRPAPYLARSYWVAAEGWSAMRDAEWKLELTQAREWIFNRLPARTRAILALPGREQARLLRERAILAASKEKTI